MENEQQPIEIYSGDRGINFENMIRSILKKGK